MHFNLRQANSTIQQVGQDHLVQDVSVCHPPLLSFHLLFYFFFLPAARLISNIVIDRLVFVTLPMQVGRLEEPSPSRPTISSALAVREFLTHTFFPLPDWAS